MTFTKCSSCLKLLDLIRGTLFKYFLDIIFCFQPMASFVTSFCYIRCFLEQNLIYRKCLSWFKLFKKIRGTIWLNTFWIPCLIFYLWRHFWRHFAIFPLFCNFIAFWSTFTWFLQNVFHGWSYLKWLEEDLATCFFIPPLIFSLMTSFVASFCYISLILELHHLFEQLKFIFKKCISWLKLFNMIRGNVWQHFYTKSRFWPMTSFVTSFCYIFILQLHRLYEQLN